jgi:hypothetical protein
MVSNNSQQNVVPELVGRDEIVVRSAEILSGEPLPIRQDEDVFRIEALGLEWDIGVMVYQPCDASKISLAADGRKIGIFLLHGGDGDFKSVAPMAKLYAERFGHKAVAMTFPGRLYLDDPSRDWPGDTINADGSVRTPMWRRGEYITRDQYDVVHDNTDRSLRLRYGTRTVARAKPGTTFYYRMAAWPMAFELGMKDAMRRHFPETEYAVFVTGHSTGGPLVFMICQRVPNVAGVIAVENSPFGFIQARQHDWSGALGKISGYDRVTDQRAPRTDPFNELYIRSWRDCARYAGPEALGREGPAALMRLPSLMEEVFAWWDQEKARPQFKAEYIITHNIAPSLEAAARVSAGRLGLSQIETAKFVSRFLGYPYPLPSDQARPVPPVLFAIAKDSRDHSPEVYREVVLPLFQTIAPPPKVRVTRFDAGTHFYTHAEPGLPLGIGPAVAKFYHDAITGGYFFSSTA